MHMIASIDASAWFLYSLVQSFTSDLVSSLLVIAIAAIVLFILAKLFGWFWNTKWKMFEDKFHAACIGFLMFVCVAGALVMNGVTKGGLLSGDTAVLTAALKLSRANDKIQWIAKASGQDASATPTTPRRPSKSASRNAADATLAQQIMDLNAYQNGKTAKLTEAFVSEAVSSISKAFNMASTVMGVSLVLLLAFVSWSSYTKIKKTPALH